METKSYKDLIVWQKAKKLVIETYSLSRQFPPQEKYGIISQLNRAAISVPLNIAEGYRRRGQKERKQFFTVAFGSATEVEALIDICKELPLSKDMNFSNLESLLDEVLRMLEPISKIPPARVASEYLVSARRGEEAVAQATATKPQRGGTRYSPQPKWDMANFLNTCVASSSEYRGYTFVLAPWSCGNWPISRAEVFSRWVLNKFVQNS